MKRRIKSGQIKKFPEWWTNPFWNFFIRYFKTKVFLFGISIFFGYWIVPLIFSYYHSTLIPEKMLNISGQIPVSYLNDYTHLIFGLAISIAGILCAYTLTKIPESINNLCNEDVLNEKIQKIHEIYLRNRKIANSIFLKIVSLIAMILTGIVFFKFFNLKQYDYWWGNKYYGYENIYFVLVEMLMVYYGTQVIFLFILNSRFLLKILKSGITPKIFHPDNCNGLSSLGNIIILKWIMALFIILCVFIVIFYGYMGLEKTILTKILIGIFSLTIPIIAILPLLRSLLEISKVKKQKLKIFGKILNENLSQIEKHAIENKINDMKSNINFFIEIQNVFDAVNKMNVFPFNPKALVSVIIIYSFQIAVTLYQLIFK